MLAEARDLDMRTLVPALYVVVSGDINIEAAVTAVGLAVLLRMTLPRR